MRLIKVFIIAGLIVVSLSGYSYSNRETDISNNLNDYTPVQLMQGIVFGYGEVGEILFADKEFDRDNSQRDISSEEENFIKRFTSYMQKNDSENLLLLKKSIIKKDPFYTEQSLTNITNSLNEFAQKHYDVKKLDDYGDVNPNACGPTVCIAAVVVVAIAHQYVGVTYAAGGGAVVYLVGATWGPGTDSTDSPEESTHKILKALH